MYRKLGSLSWLSARKKDSERKFWKCPGRQLFSSFMKFGWDNQPTVKLLVLFHNFWSLWSPQWFYRPIERVGKLEKTDLALIIIEGPIWHITFLELFFGTEHSRTLFKLVPLGMKPLPGHAFLISWYLSQQKGAEISALSYSVCRLQGGSRYRNMLEDFMQWQTCPLWLAIVENFYIFRATVYCWF